MYPSQNTLAVIFSPLVSQYPHIGDALGIAGWTCREVAHDDGAVGAAGMIVMDGRGDASFAESHPVIAAVTENGKPPPFPAELTIDPRHDVERLAAQFSQWRIPCPTGLVRMAAMFGRDDLLPVVEGLRDELAQALLTWGAVDAHRIAGLSGTLGFPIVSASWQAVDRGVGDKAAALRDSRTTLIAIDGWLRGGS